MPCSLDPRELLFFPPQKSYLDGKKEGPEPYHFILRGVIIKNLHGRREWGMRLFIWLIFAPTFLALLKATEISLQAGKLSETLPFFEAC